ncbi:hypothetical protein AALP_AA7G069900 [Arabis alpina]|uniref:Uncharacterized protein n=1 Tax=Arabis alpina TaxID=50452 RepID=A0A087GGF0_ARAAL|nr:hypothetical protein AALP_AA7G069900 [Arabis alpina]
MAMGGVLQAPLVADVNIVGTAFVKANVSWERLILHNPVGEEKPSKLILADGVDGSTSVRGQEVLFMFLD